MNRPTKIAVIVEGGVVQGVRADGAKLMVGLLDYDNKPDAESIDESEYPLELSISELQVHE